MAKLVLVLLAVLSASIFVDAATIGRDVPKKTGKIVEYSQSQDAGGSSFHYIDDNETMRREKITMVAIAPGSSADVAADSPAVVPSVEGEYSYISPEGVKITSGYTSGGDKGNTFTIMFTQ